MARRPELPRLTRRGGGLLGVGVGLVIVAAPLDSVELGRFAALAVVLPLIAIVWGAVASVRTSRVSVERTVHPLPLQVDSPATVRISARGRSLPRHSRLRERSAATLGARPGVSATEYLLRPRARGAAHLGPAVLLRGDPLGLVEFTQRTRGSDDVVVWPRAIALGDLRQALVGQTEHRRGAGVVRPSPEDLLLREYRRGDDLRRVHWRSSARHRDLMVRADEPASPMTADLLLQIHSEQRKSDLEWAVSAAASVAVALLEERFSVRLRIPGSGAQERTSSASVPMDTLALVEPTELGDRRDALVHEIDEMARSASAVCVAVLCAPDDHAVARLADLARARTCWAVVVPPRGALPDHVRATLQVLQAAGWSATLGHEGARIDQAFGGARARVAS
ncbi:protein of unknown function DUF58 [Beutenbergia cavernae DSM 12333]|uniref:DUF58 domain-containing protein n=1 Tax=Beutenbergia cavernae (strain ATCC BAA-8 / DSM 12333 / CCUG 43141 / JCM 11478 / NBRC 16432 / NCIMB 13614 / HKI 0122) TaxID=471853 RepID=C5BW70_BEUC1|nr:DUF58 domain-containing protein [Beutenbergia cavernae]ACQ80671.1 protein of unknown function DUF58 [Beutenbergia cavernae DSM 12333]